MRASSLQTGSRMGNPLLSPVKPWRWTPMDRKRPSALIDRIGRVATRRSTLRLLSVGAFCGIAGTARASGADARRKKHKRCPATISAGPPVVATITFQDRDGLESIVVTKSGNADTVVPPFINWHDQSGRGHLNGNRRNESSHSPDPRDRQRRPRQDLPVEVLAIVRQGRNGRSRCAPAIAVWSERPPAACRRRSARYPCDPPEAPSPGISSGGMAINSESP
jgi:hypothetical protein